MIETVLTKRKARSPSEIGLFSDSEVFDEDLRLVTMGEQVLCAISSPRHIEALKFVWALASKVAANTDSYLDKDECMTDLKLRAGYTKLVYDQLKREFEVRPKSLKRISNENMRALTDKMVAIVCEKLIPGMEENQLRREVEEMCNVK